ncbi:MAG TPA: 4Fe-4S binding protein [Chloroflexota bacterium]|nr:4Fe-4S binding protein [Chloroflexota bacterium]
MIATEQPPGVESPPSLEAPTALAPQAVQDVKDVPLRRVVLGRVDGLWGQIEALVDRLGGAGAVGVAGETERAARRPLNPLYHLGGLSFLLLVIVVVTGVYLVLFYKPDAEHAYQSVAGISASPVGSAIRSVHRYASQTLMAVLLLHALKMLVGDRFWGARWLSWLSGWAMLGVFWSVGVMGYWLVWDERAQWLTEYVARMNKGTALAFASPEAAARGASLFIIVLFLHVFIPALGLLGVWLHVMRLSRIRLWAPRWLAIEVVVALAAAAVWRPVQSGAPADLTRVVGEMRLDAWFLGFLPLAERLGSPAVWGTAAAVGIAALALPRALRGRAAGPAVVTDAACTGCRLCAEQCPYGAIEMRPRADGLSYATVAAVTPSLCTGCGLCVGVCSTEAIDLAGLAAERVRGSMLERVAEARARGEAPVAVFACARHVQLGTVPERFDGAPVIACGVPCAGMVHGEWVRQSLLDGARAALVVGGPHDDCAYREGPRWTHERLRRRATLQRQGVAWLEVGPGDSAAVRRALERLTERAGAAAGERDDADDLPVPRARSTQRVLRLLAALVPLVAIAAGIGALAEWRADASAAAELGQLRVVVAHKGQVVSASDSGLSRGEQARLPEGVSAAQVLGGERHPVRLRIAVQGQPAMEREYRPGGLHKEGISYGVETLAISPGTRGVRVELMDDGNVWRTVYDGEVVIERSRVRILTYDSAGDALRAQ